MLNIEALNQYYSGSHTLWDVDLEVKSGSRTCLMGRNGAGKTTLIRSIMGLLPIKSGVIRFDGVDISRTTTDDRARLGIGYVPQGREIFPRFTVEENLRIAVRGQSQIPQRVFALFPALQSLLARRGGDLSGGQQQQLAIARALVPNPRLLILDEPTEGIQPNIVQAIAEVVVKLNEEEGLTVLLAEQKLPFARKVAKEFVILEKGRLVADGSVGELTEGLAKAYLAV